MSLEIYNLVSNIHDGENIDVTLGGFVTSIEKELGDKFVNVPLENISACDCPLIFIKSGGVEGEFKKIYKKFHEPYLFLSSGMHNSLAASMEILSFLKQNNLKGEILHGDIAGVAKRIKTFKAAVTAKKRINGKRFGVIGKPSDWLISSKVDYANARKTLGIVLLDLPLDEILSEIPLHNNVKNSYTEALQGKGFDQAEIQKALGIYSALKSIVGKYDLSGLTIRCFDLLSSLKSTGCAAVSILNSEGIICGCEGDVPALLSMVILHELSGEPVFMANPSRINTRDNEVVFAHCTLPLCMADSYALDTHFESGIGVGIKGLIREGPATIFKLSSSLKEHFVSSGKILENLNERNLCRTQIRLKLDADVSCFLKTPLGNHHLICKGSYAGAVAEFLNLLPPAK